MTKKTKKIITGLSTAAMGLGAITTSATMMTSCSTNSGFTNLLNFQ